MDGKKNLEELVTEVDSGPEWRVMHVSTAVIRSISDAYKAMEAENERLREALDDMLFEYGDKYDSECILKNSSELDMIAKARTALKDSRHAE